MTQKNKCRGKKRLNIKRLLLILIILISTIFIASKLLNKASMAIVLNDYYIASDNNQITLYTYDRENEIMADTSTIYRGTKVKSNNKIKTIGNINYEEIKIDDETYYIIENSDERNFNSFPIIQKLSFNNTIIDHFFSNLYFFV